MSRRYGMGVEVVGYQLDKEPAIEAAAGREWPFDEDWYVHDDDVDNEDTSMVNDAESQLCGGESEEEFAARLAGAIWEANGEYCEVTVTATYLEDQPYTHHLLDDVVYNKWLRNKKVNQ